MSELPPSVEDIEATARRRQEKVRDFVREIMSDPLVRDYFARELTEALARHRETIRDVESVFGSVVTAGVAAASPAPARRKRSASIAPNKPEEPPVAIDPAERSEVLKFIAESGDKGRSASVLARTFQNGKHISLALRDEGLIRNKHAGHPGQPFWIAV